MDHEAEAAVYARRLRTVLDRITMHTAAGRSVDRSDRARVDLYEGLIRHHVRAAGAATYAREMAAVVAVTRADGEGVDKPLSV